MTFERLKSFAQRIAYLLLDEEYLELSIYVYGHRKGEWQGKRESDSIWPLKKTSFVPFSDYQMQVYDNMSLKLKALRAGILSEANRLLR